MKSEKLIGFLIPNFQRTKLKSVLRKKKKSITVWVCMHCVSCYKTAVTLSGLKIWSFFNDQSPCVLGTVKVAYDVWYIQNTWNYSRCTFDSHFRAERDFLHSQKGISSSLPSNLSGQLYYVLFTC